MDHVVYTDAKAKEIDKLLQGKKTMIARGAAGRKMPYGRVEENDILYFINNNAEGLVKAKARVVSIYNSPMLMRDESVVMLQMNQEKLQLTAAQKKRWGGKRYLVFIEVESVEAVEPFAIDKSQYGNMDDWLPVEDIGKVKQ